MPGAPPCPRVCHRTEIRTCREGRSMVKRWTAVLFALVLTLMLVPSVALAEPPDSPPGLVIATAHSCPRGGANAARCHAIVRTDLGASRRPNRAPSGYAPTDLQAAYNLPSSTA